MFCRKCGTEFEGNFCQNCGTSAVYEEVTGDKKANSYSEPAYSNFSNKKVAPPKKNKGCLQFVIIFIVFVGIIGIVQSQSDKNNSVNTDAVQNNENDTEDIQSDLLKFDEQTWNDFKTLYTSHNNFMKSISIYAEDQISSLDFYNTCTEAKTYFSKASLSYNYGTNDDEKTYLSSFELVALADQQAAEKLLKYIDSSKTSDLSKAQEQIQRAKDALLTIAENRVVLLNKTGLSNEEIKKKIEVDMAELESTE